MNKIITVYFLNRQQNSGLIVLAIISIVLMLLRVKITHDIYLLFLIWNLFLANVPYFLSSLIKNTLPGTITFYIIFGIWFLFLPNAFYMITDFIHLHHINNLQYLFDVLLLTCFTIAGFYSGILSLIDIQFLLEMKYSIKKSKQLIGVMVYLSAFGIYLGRILRFNSWDILSHPITLFSDSFKSIHNSETIVFTMVLGTIILLFYRLARTLLSYNTKY